MTVQIKRYANRKLYNTESSSYITLSGIADLLREGREIHVVDNETGNDISALVLSRILVDTERKAPSPAEASAPMRPAEDVPSLADRRELVQRQIASMFTLLRRYAEDVQGNLNDVRHSVAKWIHAEAEADEARPEGALYGFGPTLAPELEELIRSSIRQSLVDLELPTRSDFERLEQRIEELERSIEKLRSHT